MLHITTPRDLQSRDLQCLNVLRFIRRDFVFKPQTKEMLEVGAHQTMGVDMFVTPERLVLLDTQVRFYFFRSKFD